MEHKSELSSRKPHFPGIGRDSISGSRALIPQAFSRADPDAGRARLAEAVANEIVPRLLFFHQDIRPAHAIEPPNREEIAEFAALAIGQDGEASLHYFERMRGSGHSLESLFVHLLAPTARHMGELWEQDLCDFIDVTIGVARLQQILSSYGESDEFPVARERHRALLITTTGDKHVFGLDMVAKFMRAAGWDIWLGVGLDPTESATRVNQRMFDVVGIGLSSRTGLAATARTVELVRRASRNASVGIMVGGAAFNADPGLALQVGADATVQDAPTAVILAKALILARKILR